METPAFLAGGGEMGALIRARDWAVTPLGKPESWPQSLKTVVRTMLSTRHPMFVFWGEEGLCLYNDAYRPSIGDEKHPAILGRPARESWAEIWDNIGPQIDLVMRGGGSTWHENQCLPIIRHGKLDEVYWTYSYGPIDEESAPNGIGGVLVVCTETTQQVQVAQRQASAAARQLQMFEQAPGFMATLTGPGHVFEFVNAAFRRFCGERDYLDRPAREVFRDIGDQGFLGLLDKVYESGERYLAQRMPVRFQPVPDSPVDTRYMDVIYEPTRDDDGNVTGIFVEGQDVTAALRAETALATNEARMRKAVNALPQLVWTCKADGQCDYLSRQWIEYTGMGEKEQLGLDWLDRVIHPDDRARVYDHWMGSVGGKHPYDIDYRIKRHDGVYRWFKTRGVSIYNDAGEIDYWFGTCTDIEDVVAAREVLARSREELDLMVEKRTAQLQAAQEALRQSQKLEAMGQLTGGVAHDFNNLLTPILGGLDMLQRSGMGGERQQRTIAGALASAERAKTLVQRLLAFARRQPLQPQAIDVGRLVRDMADLIASTSGPQVAIEIDIADPLPLAHADLNQIEMALLNLSVNARDAMPDGGRLTISVRPESAGSGIGASLVPGDYISLSVADTGRGMDEATRARAVEPFFSTKGVGKGTGLGLSMVHGLAAQMGGALSVSSKPGFGTQIELWMPVSHEVAETTLLRFESSPKPEKAKKTVLLVDDEFLVRMNTADMLGDLGYEVIEARDGEEALRLMHRGTAFDILVTDHLMPGMSGEELAQAARMQRGDLPVLIVSGYADGDGIAPGFARLSKPFRSDELAKAMAEGCG